MSDFYWSIIWIFFEASDSSTMIYFLKPSIIWSFSVDNFKIYCSNSDCIRSVYSIICSHSPLIASWMSPKASSKYMFLRSSNAISFSFSITSLKHYCSSSTPSYKSLMFEFPPNVLISTFNSFKLSYLSSRDIIMDSHKGSYLSLRISWWASYRRCNDSEYCCSSSDIVDYKF